MGLLKLFVGLATADPGKIAEAALDLAPDALPDEIKRPLEDFLGRIVRGILSTVFILAVVLGALHAQAALLRDVLGLGGGVDYLIVDLVFLVGVGVTFYRQRQHPEQAVWRQFFNLYLVFSAAAVVALLLNLLLRWPFGWVYAPVFGVAVGLILWGRRAARNREQQKVILKRYQRGQIERAAAEQLLLAAGMKGQELQAQLDDATQKRIVERLIDQEIDRQEAGRLLQETGLKPVDVEAYLDRWTQNLIVLRYIRQEVSRSQARWLLGYVHGATEEKAHELLDKVDHLLAAQSGQP